MTSLDEILPSILYRLAYGTAYRLVEQRRGSELASERQRIDEAAVLAEVARRLGKPVEDEAVREGVADAVAGRRPKW